MYVHPDLEPVLAALPERSMFGNIARAREGLRRAMATRAPYDDPRLSIEDTVATGPDDSEVPVRLYRPTGAQGPLSAVLFFHGGGFVLGDLDSGDRTCAHLCVETGALVIAVDYRLAPEHPCPAAVTDAWTALCWTAARATELGVDPARIALCGHSAGACLCAGLTLRARDEGGPALAFQQLLLPALDDRADGGSRTEIDDPRVLNGASVTQIWQMYLGTDPAAAPPYAVPARATDLSGLPPAYLQVAGADPLRDEGLAYARKLIDHQVAVELHFVPGAFHLFEDWAPTTDLACATVAHWTRALRDALAEK
ncbi:alpha/beta hydrolase [Streptomyces auratus]|uniref:Esterase n=2 Tax=Streptomyces auratus AGR0001 TaxID=1160718 RepID=J1RUB0_9ACTN|nr:alpha/beta hydrolase [Streptomyces auratus]